MNDERWLSDSEQSSWRAYLRAQRLLEVALDRDLAEHGVQLSEYEILVVLSENPDHAVRMSVVADNVVQSRSRVTHTAARLERRGWVERRVCMDDRRGVLLALTAAGRRAMDGLAQVHVPSVRRHFRDHLSEEEFATMGGIMRKVAEGIAASGGAGMAGTGLAHLQGHTMEAQAVGTV